MNEKRTTTCHAIRLRFDFALVLLLLVCCAVPDQGKHLFILSGQSNMAGMDPNESFIPMVQRAFGEDQVIVVKNAKGGQPFRRWYKGWKSATGEVLEPTGDLYDSLMTDVRAAIAGEQIASVTFIWMQGERDAREGHGEVYAASFSGLIAQLSEDLQRDDISFVIGRLSDFDMNDSRYPHWTRVREVQVDLAEAHARGAWVNTDDLNEGLNRRGDSIANDLHYSVEGYRKLGERFAEAAIKLVRKTGG